MFLTYGVRNVTMDLLASDLGVSKRTLYELFKDKDALVIECLRYMLIEDNKEVLKIIEASENVIEAMFLITQRQEKRMQEFPKVFIEDIKKYFPAVNESFYSCQESLREFSASYNLLEKGLWQEIFRKELKIELVDAFIHELISLIHYSERLRLLSAESNDILLSIFLPYFRGICTGKGLDLMEKYFSERNENNTIQK